MIDAHFHCWQLDRGDYGWLTPALAPIYRDVSVHEWWQRAQVHGVTGGVLVQAAPTEAETHFLLAQADAHPQVMGVVGWVDMLAPDAAARIAHLTRHSKLKGLRPMLQDIADPDWILQPGLTPALQAMAHHGLVLDALVKPLHLQRILRLIQRHPALRVVIDHGAKPSVDVPLSVWAQDLQAIAHATSELQVACKWSGLLTELPSGADKAVLTSWSQVLLSVWGPRRLIWGSDWPVLDLAADYTGWQTWSVDFLRQHCSPDDMHRVLDSNARSFYQLAPV